MEEKSYAAELVTAIQHGDVASVERLLATVGDAAASPLGGRHRGRTPLHVAADWPGFWPNAPRIVRTLIAAGAGPDARLGGDAGETPLHWAASSDDAEVARALIDGGADIDAPDGSIGTPVENAVGYGCWDVARLLADRGARVERPWVAAALGNLEVLDGLVTSGAQPDPDAMSQAFWHACSAGQRRVAEYLLERGADVNWIPPYATGTPLQAVARLGTQRDSLLRWLRERGARDDVAADTAAPPTI